MWTEEVAEPFRKGYEAAHLLMACSRVWRVGSELVILSAPPLNVALSPFFLSRPVCSFSWCWGAALATPIIQLIPFPIRDTARLLLGGEEEEGPGQGLWAAIRSCGDTGDLSGSLPPTSSYLIVLPRMRPLCCCASCRCTQTGKRPNSCDRCRHAHGEARLHACLLSLVPHSSPCALQRRGC